MKQLNRNFLILAIGVVMGLSIAIGHSVLAERKAETAVLPLEDLRSFTDVFSKIKSDYVEEVEDKTLLENAIRGMLANLDPHSTYLDAESFKELQVGTTGEFGGLGIEVTMENGFIKVMSPIDDTPAQKAGIKAGDVIIRLDETPVKGLSLKEAVDIMRGKPGDSITLTIIREGLEKPLKITLVRAVIKVKSVKSRMLEEGFAYLRITQFQTNTAENMLQAIATLKKENKGDLKGLILDLRNDPGGVLNAAVSVSDAFLEGGLIVYTEGRIPDSAMKFSATPNDVLNGAPIVVLINSGSASASEIVAGALQDHKRAVIMGSQSFGKGSVQTVLPLNNGAALKLTTARYFTPSGRSIQAEGIKPDIPLGKLKLTSNAEAAEFEPVTEANLTGHLQQKDTTKANGNGNKSGAEQGEGEKKSDPGNDSGNNQTLSLADADYEVHEALNLLKGLYILRKN